MPVLQGLRPVCESVGWLRSQRFWATAGIEIFTSGEVPYIVTNDGDQSRKAVELYIESLKAAEAVGQREPMSYVLELGVGVGLFAKLFLDQLRARSIAEGRDYYERTKYLASDGSRTLLNDTRESGVFADHEDRVERLHLPVAGLRTKLAAAAPNGVDFAGAIRAVHANYILDSLPFTILALRGADIFELQVRTRLHPDVAVLSQYFPEDDDETAIDSWFNAHDEILGDSFVFESEYVPVNRESLPYSSAIPQPAEDATRVFIHSYGALCCMEEVLDVLRPDGHMVAVDYGYTESKRLPEIVEFQCFGASIASGVNFAQLTSHARNRSDSLVGCPASDPESLQARLVARDQVSLRVIERFEEMYSRDAWERLRAPYVEAVELVRQGRYEAARWKFDTAYQLQPLNWTVLEAIAAFLTYNVEDHASALEVAKKGVQLNHLSSRLWNILGDSYYGLGDLDSAESVYRHAMRVNPGDVRGRTNLVYVLLRRGEQADALRMIGEALSLDTSGEHREELLHKQAEALDAVSKSNVRAIIRGGNRLVGHHDLPKFHPAGG
jgi:Flp pilus assembly protein TadD